MTSDADSEKRARIWEELRRQSNTSADARRLLSERVARLEARQETLTRLAWAILAMVLAGNGLEFAMGW